MRKARSTLPMLAGAALLVPFLSTQPGFSGSIATPLPVKSSHNQIQAGRAMTFRVQSTAFANGSEIAKKFTCSGADLSPALSWSGVPAGTHSLALISDDPDAPASAWTHWIVWNIPPQTAALPEGVAKTEALDNGARQGTNDFGRIGYGGPCSPPGKPHRYFFKLYALDAMLDLKQDATRKELDTAMKGHVLSQAEVMGKYKR